MRLVLALLLSTCTSLGKALGAECPDFWTPFQGSCYALSQKYDEWAEANFMCEEHGGHLAYIETEAENAFITTFINHTQVHRSTVWIAANDIMIEGNFTWGATNEPVKYSNWNHGEPTNQNGNENCVVINAHSKWNDVPCSKHYNFICERSPSDGIIG